MKNILIGGIGGVLLGDDGVGPYLARMLDAYYQFDDGVEVIDLGTPALELIDQLSGRDAVILIDAIKADAMPGEIVLFRKADIVRQGPSERMDPHAPALVDALLSAELFGVAPSDLLLVGIQVESCDATCSLSAPVKASLEKAIAEVLRELDRLHVGYKRREHPNDLDIWWDVTPSAQCEESVPLV